MEKNEIESTKQENFKRIAIKRKEKIIELIDSLSDLSNGNYYMYTEDQINKLFIPMYNHLDHIQYILKSRFHKRPYNKRFKL